MLNVFISGAAGNLGGLLARHLLAEQPETGLLLMQHRKAVPSDVAAHPRVEVRPGDLSDKRTLKTCLQDADVIVHFAGVLFRADPDKFLPTTNVRYFENLVDTAKELGIGKVILISFPHVEGPSSRQNPATGRLDKVPISVHAQTRLEEERYLFSRVTHPVSLRVGMVYGKGILMIDAAHWLARRRLLGVWRKTTEIHLISKTDFCRAVTQAIVDEKARGIYHVGDEGSDTLQSFLDFCCDNWACPRPLRLPLPMIYQAAMLCEWASRRFDIPSPLTRDFIDIGSVSYYGDTRRFRNDLLPELTYRNVSEGFGELKP
jgi:nucleoside-diphosphate-sugar epimerase